MKYVIANWKMNMDLNNVNEWVKEFGKLTKDSQLENTPIICSTNLHLMFLHEIYRDTFIKVGGQDVSIENKGAHTGETGAFQLEEFTNYCIIGHSERKEPLETVIQKRDMCLQSNITPIICFINNNDVEKLYTNDCLMAWEDPKNISKNGVYAESNFQEIEEKIKVIREIMPKGAKLIYGGSVNTQNVEELAKIETLDGVLVGNASLNPLDFYTIANKL